MNVRMLNDQQMQLERIFLTQNVGLPLQENSTKHTILSFEKGADNNHLGSPTFPGIVNLLDDLVKMKSDDDQTPAFGADGPKAWQHWEALRRHVTEIYVMIIQAASHLEPHHII